MSDVNVSQTYRINIEVGRNADKTIDTLRNFKGTLEELNNLSKTDNIDGKIGIIATSIEKLKYVADTFSKKTINKFTNLATALKRLESIKFDNSSFEGLGEKLRALETLDLDFIDRWNEKAQYLDTTKLLEFAKSISYAAKATKDLKSTELMDKKLKQDVEETTLSTNKFVSVLERLKETKFGKGLSKEFSNIRGAISKTMAFLTRFVKYRVANMFFRALTKDIQTGISNIYQWSKAMNGEVAQTLDNLKTSSNYLMNSFAALATNVLGVLMPAFEWLTDVLVRLLNVINEVISYISGGDTWNQAIKKQAEYQASINGTAKALGKLAGFDEINNIGNSNKSGGTDVTNPYEFQKVEVDTSRAETNLRRLLDGVNLLIGAFSILKGLELGKYLELTGSQALGLGLTIAGIVTTITNLIAYLNDPTFKNFGSLLISIGVTLSGLALMFASWPLGIAVAVVLVLGVFNRFKDQINGFASWLQEKIGSITGGGILGWIHTNLTESENLLLAFIGYGLEVLVTNFKENFNWLMDILNGFSEGLKQILDGIIMFIKGDFKGGFKSAWEGIKQIFDTVWSGIWSKLRITLNTIIYGIESMVNFAIRGINALLEPLRDVTNGLADFLNINWEWKRFNTISLPRLSTGTNYVPEDTLAMIHKGEAVIPKEFNSQEYFGGTNDETNELIRELIDVVRNKNFSITKKEVGQASIEYIKSQSRLKGASVI